MGTGPESAPSAPVTPTGTCTACTIWPSTTTPVAVDAGDPSSVELGVKFKSDVNGSITGIRFYKSTGNTGTHVGNLWSASGTKLASVTFTGESASGWQQATFAASVAITAGTVYVARYFAPVGHYAGDGGYFAAGVDDPPLHALKDGDQWRQRRVRATPAPAPSRPTRTTRANYWVDVVFNNAPATSPGAPTGGDRDRR